MRQQLTSHWFANSQPLSIDQILQEAPSAGALAAAPRTTKRYGFVPTRDVITTLQGSGFECVGARQSRTRSVDRQGYQKHVLQFTLDKFRQVQFGKDSGDLRIVISNSHDGGGSYQGSLGVYRHTCLNSLVAQLSFGSFRVRHHQGAAGEVLEATYRILDDIPQLEERISRYQRTFIPFEKQAELAERAIGLRWGKDAAPFGVEALLVAHRDADQGDDLWRVFNRVQENIVKGGIPYKGTLKGKTITRHTRAVTSSTVDLQLNRGLWEIADSYAGV